jgi:glycosyltransferase involved in cell wall biosynthesis
LDTLRVGFLGRWDPVKGVHILVDAFKRLPAELPIALDVRAVGGEGEMAEYRHDVQASAVGDRRISFLSTAPDAEVGAFLAGLDVLAVPSQWLETGPLVVLEAFAAGTPVIGSDLGGIKELVGHERDGLLVPHDDVRAWTTAMLRLVRDRALHLRLRQGIGPVRKMTDVARDMAAVYRELMATDPNAA